MLIITDATLSTGNGNETERKQLLIDGETIQDILPTDARPPDDAQVLDAHGMLVLPGGIDPHVHFNTPGYTEHEDFTSGSMSAARGGITCVIDMPDTSLPPVTGAQSFRTKLASISPLSVCDFALWGGVSRQALQRPDWQQEIAALRAEGVVGLKCYLLSGMSTFEHLLPLELCEVMSEATSCGMLVGLHAEDRERVQRLTEELQAEGRTDPKAYYEARCDPAELEGMALGTLLAEETGARLHIVHVGSSSGANYVLHARDRGADISMETCPQYLAFTSEDLIERGSILKTSPVVKTGFDAEKLWEYLSSGGIQFVASDHAPCTRAEKETGNIWTDYAGISGTELLLPFVLSEGWAAGRLTLERLVEVTSRGAAKRFGLFPRKGAIAKGSDADLVFIDPLRRWTVRGAEFASKGKFTPFEGRSFLGKVVGTMCRGTMVFEEERGVVVEPGFGQFIRPNA